MSQQTKMVIRLNGQPIPASGVVGFISWQRLVEQLRRAGEFKDTESVLTFELSDDGIQYHLGKKA